MQKGVMMDRKKESEKRLLAFETMLEAVQKNYEDVNQKMGRLKKEGIFL